MGKKQKNKMNKQEDSSLIDKLRDDLFKYRVDILSYKNKINTLILAGTIIISVLAFFGYNKIENIEKTIMYRANERLAITDTLLAKIDQSKIDSLNLLILSREQEYNVLIANFENIIEQSLDLQGKMLGVLSENERTASRAKSYRKEYPTSLFNIYPIIKNLRKNQVEYVYLIINDEIDISEDDYLSIALYPKGRRIILLEKNYEVSSRFNKMSFAINTYEDYKDYELEISYFKKEGDIYIKCCIIEEITLL